MKNIRKKVIVSFLSMMVVSGVLAGCGKKANQADTPAASATPSTPVELKVEVFDRGKPGQAPVDNNYWTKWIQDNFGNKNNITMKFVVVPRSQEVDKLNIMMASNEVPDIVFTYDQNIVYNYVKQGGLTELDSLLTQHGPNLKKYMGDDLLNYGKFNGKLFAITAKRTFLGDRAAYIRQDWLDILGLPLPKTTEEFYNTMVAFRDKNPGKVKNVVPVGATSSLLIANLQESFLEGITEEQLATLPNWKQPGYKDAERFLNKLYNEKLLSPEFAIDKDGKKLDADLAQGNTGLFGLNFDYALRTNPGVYNALKKVVPTAKYVAVDTFATKSGKYRKNVYSPNGIFLLIPKSSKRAAEAIKYLDWMSKTENTFFLENGEEGLHHKLVDGIPQLLPVEGEKAINSTYNIDYDLIHNGVELGDPAKNLQAIAKTYIGYEAEAKKAIEVSTKDGYTNFWFNTPLEQSAKYSKILADKSTEMNAKLVTAKPADFDKLYDSLVDEYMKAGGQQVMDEKIKVYKEQTKK